MEMDPSTRRGSSAWKGSRAVTAVILITIDGITNAHRIISMLLLVRITGKLRAGRALPSRANRDASRAAMARSPDLQRSYDGPPRCLSAR
jgi:hypothetical protein